MSNTSIELRFFQGYDNFELQKLMREGGVQYEIDLFEHALDELFDIDHPALKPEHSGYAEAKINYIKKYRDQGPFTDQGVWVYYHWNKTLIHFPAEHDYIKLRTSRNRNLITSEEQKKFQSKCIGIAGMSVGSNILNTIVMVGGPRHIKIADYDTISIPNLNRIMAPASAVGINKAVYFARKSLEVDPFIKIEIFERGMCLDNFDDFFTKPKLDLFIEEMDNPYLKIQCRLYAKKIKIPVIQAADNGDGTLVDVERFDTDVELPLFHGRFDGVLNLNDIKEDMSFVERMTLIANIVHLEEATTRAQDSLGEVGKVLNTWPQLGTAALACGISVTFIARQILLDLPMPSGRYSLSLDEDFIVGFTSTENVRKRQLHTTQVMNAFNEILKNLNPD